MRRWIDFLFFMHQVVGAFCGAMNYYFTFPLIASILMIAGLMCRLLRSYKPVAIVIPGILMLHATYTVIVWTGLDFRFYQWAMLKCCGVY